MGLHTHTRLLRFLLETAAYFRMIYKELQFIFSGIYRSNSKYLETATPSVVR